MARENIIVAAVIVGVLAVAFSFAAYANRIKALDIKFLSDGSCIYPSSSAYAMGVVAALVLLVEQILVSVWTGCFCCRPRGCPSGYSGVFAIKLFFFSWISFWISFSTLMYTALYNDRAYLTNLHKVINIPGFCPLLGHKKVFIAAPVWCIITIIVGISSVTLLNSHDNLATRNNNNFVTAELGGAGTVDGVPTGQPYLEMQPEPHDCY